VYNTTVQLFVADLLDIINWRCDGIRTKTRRTEKKLRRSSKTSHEPTKFFLIVSIMSSSCC